MDLARVGQKVFDTWPQGPKEAHLNPAGVPRQKMATLLG